MILLPTTLGAAAVATFINVWLMIRIGSIRRAADIGVGDGGNERLIRRMRAQANFIENTPILLVLLALIELARPGHIALLIIATLYAFGRVAHALGMDGGKLAVLRTVGTGTSMLIHLVLGVWALVILTGHG